MSYTLLGATTFGVTYDRDVTYSYQVIKPYYLDNSVGLFVRRAVGGRYDVIVNFAGTLALTCYVVLCVEFPRWGFVRLAPFDNLIVAVRQSMG